MSGYVDFSSNGVGSLDYTYSVAKFTKVRKQWALCVHTPGVMDVAAYFRTEEHARDFVKTFGLTITDHRREVAA